MAHATANKIFLEQGKKTKDYQSVIRPGHHKNLASPSFAPSTGRYDQGRRKAGGAKGAHDPGAKVNKL